MECRDVMLCTRDSYTLHLNCGEPGCDLHPQRGSLEHPRYNDARLEGGAGVQVEVHISSVRIIIFFTRCGCAAVSVALTRQTFL
jgi:hypothetical protein